MSNQIKYKIIFCGNSKSIITIIFLNLIIKNLSKNFEISQIIDTCSIDKDPKIIHKIKSKIFLFLNHRFKIFKKKFDLFKFKSIEEITYRNNIKFTNFNQNIKISNGKTILLNCGGDAIFSKNFIEKFYLAINYHHAELPKFRGSNSNVYSLFKNSNYTFYSFNFLSKEIDKGYVFFKKKIIIDPNNLYHMRYEMMKAIDASENIEKVLKLSLKNRQNKKKKVKSKFYYNKNNFLNFFSEIEKFRFRDLEKFINIYGGFYYKKKFVTSIIKNKNGIKIRDSNIKINSINFLPTYLYKPLFTLWNIIK